MGIENTKRRWNDQLLAFSNWLLANGKHKTRNMRNFRKWDVYSNAKDYSVLIYHITKEFPGAEKFGLISQLRRASVSVVANT